MLEKKMKKESCTTTGYSCLKSEVAAKTSFQFYVEAEFRYQNHWHGFGLVLWKLGFKKPVLSTQTHDIVSACYVLGGQ